MHQEYRPHSVVTAKLAAILKLTTNNRQFNLISGRQRYVSSSVPSYTLLKRNNLQTFEQNVELTATLDPLMLLEPRFRLLCSSLNHVSAIYE